MTPLVALTLAYGAGLLFGRGFLYFPGMASSLAILCAVSAGILVRRKKLTLRKALLLVLPAIVGMAAYLYSAVWLPADHYSRRIPVDRSEHDITGKIVSPLDREPEKTGFVMAVRDIDGAGVSGMIRVTIRAESVTFGYGDIVRFKGKLFKPAGFNNPGGFDYPAYLARSGIYYSASVKNAARINVLSRGTGILRSIQDLRERIRQAFLASTAGPGSAILLAMTLGEEGMLTDDMRDRFMAAGVTHIISISGSHLGMLSVICFSLIRGLLLMIPERRYHQLTLAVDPKKLAAWFTFPLIIFYALLAGGQVATIRSLTMIAAALIALILDREAALTNALALAALLILAASPQAIFDISFQLSFISVVTIGFVVSFWNELGLKARNTVRKAWNGLLLLVLVSLATTAATGPLVAHYFNQISFAGVLSNLIVVPFAGMIVVPLGLLSGLLSLSSHHLPFPGLLQFVADAFIKTVSFFSRLPLAEIHTRAPDIPFLAFHAIFLYFFAVHVKDRVLFRFKPFEHASRSPRVPVAGMAASGAILMLLTACSFLPKERLMISFPDVGQGDCALVELSSGKTILIDGGGTRDNRFDIGRRVVAPFLWNKGIHRLDLVILSHPHPDHMNGLVSVMKLFEIGEVWDSGLDATLPGYEAFAQALGERRIVHRRVSADEPPSILGGAELSVLHPGRGFFSHARKAYATENDRSLVIRIVSGGRTFLFAGDIGEDAERCLLKTGSNLTCDLLKVPHHGSKGSSTGAFVSRTRPAAAIMTVGRGNLYGHPSKEVVGRYEQRGTRIYRTDLGGALFVTTATNALEVVQWNDLTMNRIRPGDGSSWKKTEGMNGRRLLLRTAGF